MPKNARRWIVIEVVTPSPPIYRQLLSSRNPSDPYNNRELRDDNAETSVFSKFRPMFAGVNVSFHL